MRFSFCTYRAGGTPSALFFVAKPRHHLPVTGPQRDKAKRAISALFDLLWMRHEDCEEVALGARATIQVLLEESSRLRRLLLEWQSLQPEPPYERDLKVYRAARKLGLERPKPESPWQKPIPGSTRDRVRKLLESKYEREVSDLERKRRE